MEDIVDWGTRDLRSVIVAPDDVIDENYLYTRNLRMKCGYLSDEYTSLFETVYHSATRKEKHANKNTAARS